MSDAGNRLYQLREKSGLQPEQLARESEIPILNYYHLESTSGDALCSATSLKELLALGNALKLDPIEFFFDAHEIVHENISFGKLQNLLQLFIDKNDLSIEQFEKTVGWEVTDFLNSSDAAWNWTVDCLRDICEKIHLDWKLVLPKLNRIQGDH